MNTKLKDLQTEKILSRKEDPARSTALGLVIDKVKKTAKAEKREVVDSDFIAAAKSLIKANLNTVEGILKNESVADDFVADKYYEENEIYKEFLPQETPEEDMRREIEALVDTIPEDKRTIKLSMGRIMGHVKKQFGDSANMEMASIIAKEILA